MLASIEQGLFQLVQLLYFTAKQLQQHITEIFTHTCALLLRVVVNRFGTVHPYSWKFATFEYFKCFNARILCTKNVSHCTRTGFYMLLVPSNDESVNECAALGAAIAEIWHRVSHCHSQLSLCFAGISSFFQTKHAAVVLSCANLLARPPSSHWNFSVNKVNRKN